VHRPPWWEYALTLLDVYIIGSTLGYLVWSAVLARHG